MKCVCSSHTSPNGVDMLRLDKDKMRIQQSLRRVSHLPSSKRLSELQEMMSIHKMALILKRQQSDITGGTVTSGTCENPHKH